MGPQATAIANLLYKVIADSSAVDLEALVVLRGRRAWTLYLDLTVLNHDGNLTDLAVFSAMAVLSSFRLPQTKVASDGKVSVIPADEQEPLALTIQHVPFAVTFALIGSADVIAVDPSRLEAAAAAGTVTIICNEFEEICGAQKVDGIGMQLGQLLRCVRLASTSAADYGKTLSAALARHRHARVQHRVRRVAGGAATTPECSAYASGKGRMVVVAMGRSGDAVEVGSAACVTPHLQGLAVRGLEAEGGSAVSASSPMQGLDVRAGSRGMNVEVSKTASAMPHMHEMRAAGNSKARKDGSPVSANPHTQGGEMGAGQKGSVQGGASFPIATTTAVALRKAQQASSSGTAAASHLGQDEAREDGQLGDMEIDTNVGADLDAGRDRKPPAARASLAGRRGESLQGDPQQGRKQGKNKKRRSADREGVRVLASSGVSAGPIDAQQGFDNFAAIAQLIAGPAGAEQPTLEKGMKRRHAKKKRQDMAQ
jgi:hypothetical protein